MLKADESDQLLIFYFKYHYLGVYKFQHSFITLRYSNLE